MLFAPHLSSEDASSPTDGSVSGAAGQTAPQLLTFLRSDTAVVIIDPQNDVLSEKGLAWPLLPEDKIACICGGLLSSDIHLRQF